MKTKFRVLVHVAILIALEVVLSRFLSIATPITKIGFGFVPVAVCAIIYGPLWGGICGAASDFLGAILFPIGPYFPGFTFSAGLTGIVFGLFLERKKASPVRLASCVAVNNLGISLVINTYWLTILAAKPFLVLLPTRIVQSLVMIPVQFALLGVLQGPVLSFSRRLGR